MEGTVQLYFTACCWHAWLPMPHASWGSPGTAGAAANRQLEPEVSPRPLLLPISYPPVKTVRNTGNSPLTQALRGSRGCWDLHLPAKVGGKLQAASRLHEPAAQEEHPINRLLLTPSPTRPETPARETLGGSDRHRGTRWQTGRLHFTRWDGFPNSSVQTASLAPRLPSEDGHRL